MPRYAANTTVSSNKSRDEIERTLARYGADQFMYGWQDGGAVIAFRAHDRRIRFILPLPDRRSREFTHHDRGPRQAEAAERLYEQAVRQRWRALALVIKAKLDQPTTGRRETYSDGFAMGVCHAIGRIDAALAKVEASNASG